jgi:hypothetical protein
LGIGVDGKVKSPCKGGYDQVEPRKVMSLNYLVRIDKVGCLRRNAIFNEQLPGDIKRIVPGGRLPKPVVEAIRRFLEISQIEVRWGRIGEVTVKKNIECRETTTDVKDVGRCRRKCGLDTSKISMDTALEAANNDVSPDSCLNARVCEADGTREVAKEPSQEGGLVGCPLEEDIEGSR